MGIQSGSQGSPTSSESSETQIAIHPVQTGEVQIKTRQAEPRHERRPARVLDVLFDRQWTPRLPIACYAIEHPDGVILVDTGESSRASDPSFQPWWHPFARTSARFWVAPEEEAGPQLRALGHAPESIAKVVMTHMHTDHAGGLEHFEGAEILLSEREAAAALGRTGPVNGYFNWRYPSWFEPTTLSFEGDPWETFDASIALTSDGAVRLVPTPGHTLGHLSVVVDRSDHLVLLTGDATYSEEQLLRGGVDGVAESAKLHRDSTARIRELCGRRDVIIAPAHDPLAAERLATRRFTEIA